MLLDYADFAGFKTMALDYRIKTCNSFDIDAPSGFKSQAFTRMLFRKNTDTEISNMILPASVDVRGETRFFDPLWYNDGPLARYDSTIADTYKVEFNAEYVTRNTLFDVIFGMVNFKGKWRLEFGGYAIGGLAWDKIPLFNFYGEPALNAYFRIIFETAEAAVIYKLTL